MEGSSLVEAAEAQDKTMELLIQNLTDEDKFHNLEVDVDSTVEDLKCLLEIESGMPVNDQAIFYKNQELKEDGKKLVDFGIGNNDMLMMTKMAGVIQRGGGANLGQSDKNLLDNFFTTLNQDVQQIQRAPKMNFNQMFNQLYHNQMNQRIKMEVDQIQQIWANDPPQRTFLKNNSPELAAALEKGERKAIEKIVGEKLKIQMEEKKKEQERMARLMNADPNDPEAQKQIEE